MGLELPGDGLTVDGGATEADAVARAVVGSELIAGAEHDASRIASTTIIGRSILDRTFMARLPLHAPG